MTYYERIAVLFNRIIAAKRSGTHRGRKQNRREMQEGREGDFMIQMRHHQQIGWRGCEQQYIDYSYADGGWYALGCRRHAAWFKREELKEVLQRLGPHTKVTRVTAADRRRKEF